MVTKNAAYDLSCNFCVGYAAASSADLSANFTLNQNYADLSANFTIGGHALLSANFTIGNKADLSANFTLNQNYADLSANFTVRNRSLYFLYVIHHGGSNYTTPKPIDNLIIKTGNRDKIASCDVMFSNKDDRFSWVQPNSELLIYVGSNANNTTKLFGGTIDKTHREEERIIFHCKGYGEELQRKKISGTYYDIEATDLIKNKLLPNLSINPGVISYDGTMTERLNFITNNCTDSNDFTFSTMQVYNNQLELLHDYADDYLENHLTKYWGVSEGFQNLYIQWDSTEEQSESYCGYIKHRRMMDRSIWLGGYIEVPPGPPCGSKDLSTDFTTYENFVLWIKHHSTTSPKLRLHTGNTGNNYFERAITITAADTWEYNKYPVGSGASGWTTVGSPDWTAIDWYELFFHWYDWDVYDSRTYIDIWSPANYELTGTVTTNSYNTVDQANTVYPEYFDGVRVSLLKNTPSGTSIVIKASNDAGSNWTTLTESVWTQLTDTHATSPYGKELQIKLELTGNTLNGSADATPTISYITVDVRSKKITIYDRIEFADEFLFDALNEVLYDAHLEGYVSPDKLYVVSGVINTSASNPGIPYLRQGDNILTIPTFKKDARSLINKQKVIGSANGALSSSEVDSLTEGSASNWTATDITITDSTSNLHVMEGDQCLHITISESSGWFDPCDDESFNETYYEKVTTGTTPYDGEVVEGGTSFPYGDYILTLHYTKPYSDTCVAYFYLETAYEFSGDFEFSFDVSVGAGSQTFVWFVNNAPQQDTDATMKTNWEYIWWDVVTFTVYLNTGGSNEELGYLNPSRPAYQWANIKIIRSGSTHEIYYNNELKWSGTFSKTPSAHDNIQLGQASYEVTGVGLTSSRFKNISWNYVSGSGNVVSPSFAKNLDLYKNLFCYYEQDGSDSFEIRLETDASNYYTMTLKPTQLNKMYPLILPVGNISSGWTSSGSPDWTAIDKIRVVYSEGNISSVYLDKLYFTIGEVSGTAEDTTSQSQYGGVYEAKTIINRTLLTEGECLEHAKAIIEAKKNLHEPVDITVVGRRDINSGDVVKIHFPRSGITNLLFRVDEVQHILGTVFLTQLKCRDFDTFTNESLLKRLDRETKRLGD